MQDLERVQAVEWSVCRKVGTCAARSDRVQEVGACAVRLELVQRGWSVCSEV